MPCAAVAAQKALIRENRFLIRVIRVLSFKGVNYNGRKIHNNPRRTVKR